MSTTSEIGEGADLRSRCDGRPSGVERASRPIHDHRRMWNGARSTADRSGVAAEGSVREPPAAGAVDT
jgi:hypothetical protein